MSIYDLESIRGFRSSSMEKGIERESLVGITQRKITCFISAFQIFVCSFTLIYNLDAHCPVCILCCHKAEQKISTVYLWKDWEAVESTFAFAFLLFLQCLCEKKSPVISCQKISMSQTLFTFAKFHCKTQKTQ